MSHRLHLGPDGRIRCLNTEAIDLQKLGRLEIVRATDIAFREAAQQWEVRCAATGAALFAHASRAACLRWEQENLQPPAAQP